MLGKLNEEVKELIEAIQKNNNEVHEAADVLYHLLVLLEGSGIKIEDVMKELKKRQNGYLIDKMKNMKVVFLNFHQKVAGDLKDIIQHKNR